MGARSKDPEKYKKDAEAFVKAIESKEEPELYGRYCFYAGQSFRDSNDFENTIKYYKKAIVNGGWNEEMYISWMEIGLASIKLKKDKTKVKEIEIIDL